MKPYLDLRTKSGRPVWNGETGENKSSGWSAAMIALHEKNHIGWNEWTFKKVKQSANFYSIPEPANWSSMLTFFKAWYKDPKAAPPADAATIMMDLANSAATSKCTLQTSWLKATFNK